MDYIIIPTKNKSEMSFFMGLLKRMKKEASTLSSDEMEDMAFIAAMKEAEGSGMGSLAKVKKHLEKNMGQK